MSAKRDLDVAGKAAAIHDSCDPLRPLPGPRSKISLDWFCRGLLWVVVLFALSTAFAQPQAPIVWGEGRWFDDVPYPGAGLACPPRGDTVLAIQYGNYPFDLTAAVSFDDGQSFGAWAPMDTSTLYFDMSRFAASGLYAQAFLGFVNGSIWTRTSSDGGQSWSPLSWFGQGTPWDAMAFGRTIGLVGAGGGGIQVSVSTDLGATWQTHLRTLSTSVFPRTYNTIAVTRSKVLVVGNRYEATDSTRIYVAAGERSADFWYPFQTLPEQPRGDLYGLAIAADTSSETAMVIELRWNGTAMGMSLYRTTDGGETWQPPQLLDPDAIREDFFPYICCSGKLSATAWKHNVSADTSQRGIYCLFSANHGRNWYPKQRIDRQRAGTGSTYGQFVGSELRVHWGARPDTSTTYFNLREVRGVLAPDTLAPVLDTGIPLEEEIAQGSTVQFLSTAWDNDSLPYMQVVLKRQGNADSVVVLLSERVSPTDYRGTWTVPDDTALWYYYYRAEDMWENVSVYPDTGLFSFHTAGWSSASALSPNPSALSISVFPSPSNGMPSLQLSEDWFRHGAVRVAVYNLLGQKVWEQAITASRTDMASHVPTAEASGVYVLSVTNAETTRRQKILILK